MKTAYFIALPLLAITLQLTGFKNKMDEIGKTPDTAYLPTGCVSAGPVPMMGAHWIDGASPELNGQPLRRRLPQLVGHPVRRDRQTV